MQVGRYKFVDRLAVGGMAEVFVAIAHGSAGFEKPVVIKRLLPQLAAMPRFRQMFLDEARTMATLHHGNIVQILDMGKMDGIPFLALEYVDGRDLRSVLARARQIEQPIPYPLMAYVGAEVCRALDYAHRKRDERRKPLHIIHRDVNPANIFLSHEGAVKVGDFGLAKARDNLEKSEVGLIKGKFSYLSPEQASSEPIDHRSDIFSLGTTLYEVTCRQRPFNGENQLEVVNGVVQGRYNRPSEVCPDYPPALEAIVMRALQREPKDRYATAAAMGSDLTQYLHRQSSAATDRDLTAFLNELFGGERRSPSLLIRLPPTSALPPPMTSVTHAGGLSEFRHSEGGSPPPVPVEELIPLDETSISVVAVDSRQRTRRLITAWVVAGVAFAMLLAGLVLHGAKGDAGVSLEVVSVPPGASILLDGHEIGRRTPAVIHALEVGREYRVGLRHSQTAPAERPFRFEDGGEYSHRFTLRYLDDKVQIESQPTGADVFVDDEMRGQTPLSLLLRRGHKYQLTLRKSGFASKTFFHQAGEAEASIRIALEAEAGPKQGSPARAASPWRADNSGILEIDTDLEARVYIDGRPYGRTPKFRRRLGVGRYFIVVKPADGKPRHEGFVWIRAGKTNRLFLTPSKVAQ